MNLPLKDRIDAATEKARQGESEGFRALRTGALEHRPGIGETYFGALDIAHGMLRDLAMYVAYPMLMVHRDCRDASVTATMARRMLPTLANYLAFSGFEDLRPITAELVTALETASVEAQDALLAAYIAYLNALYSWAYFTFPWHLGDGLRYPPAAAESLQEYPDTLVPTDCLLRLRWEPLGIEVRAFLATDKNVELCEDILAVLPFQALQTHPMAAGESLMAWAPIVTTAPTPFKEEIRRAPVGRLRFNASTGHKFIVQYGLTSEDILAPVIGSVLPEDRHLLPAVGAAVWTAQYETKEPIWLHVERI